MKTIPIALSPTRSRALNVFLGLVLSLVSVLFFLSLATYHPADPSMNTATSAEMSHAIRNWIGLFGAYLSDLFLQFFGLTTFLFPLWLGGLGWSWMRSRSGGSPLLRWMGFALAIVFLPAVFGLLPWHWLWLHALPVEGVVGRIVASTLVVYLNIQGAWLVSAALAVAGVYFASAISFWALKAGFEDRWINVMAWHDRWQNWREERAERQRELEDRHEEQTEPGPAQRLFSGAAASAPQTEPETEAAAPRLSRFAAFFSRRNRNRAAEPDPVDEIPAFQRIAAKGAEEPIPARRVSIWERTVAESGSTTPSPSVPPVPMPAAPAPVAAAPAAPPPASRSVVEMRPAQAVSQAASPAARQEVRQPAPTPLPAASHTGSEIAIHERADAEERSVTVAPKNVSGFKLPPSTLLNSGSGPQVVREDDLRDEARVLVEKCAEFDVTGQVVQINPGPMVTTYEFKPEAGVKYSRVTGLAEDLCLAMRAESILIERMAGQEHGRHPGAEP